MTDAGSGGDDGGRDADAGSTADPTTSDDPITSNKPTSSEATTSSDQPTAGPSPTESDRTGAAGATASAGRESRRRVLATVLALAALGFLVVRLGASLVGLRVFLGLNLLNRYAPWAKGSDTGLAGSSIYVQDQLDFFIPGLHELAERLVTGDLAGWSSYAGGGSSLLGTPVFGLVSLSRWVYFLLPTWLAPGWSKLLELAVAAGFTYLLARRLNASKLAAGLAGFVYPTTGFMIAWTNWPQTGVGALIPMLFWSIERFVQVRRIRAAIPVALSTALLLFGGFPAVAGLTLYAAAGYAVVRVVAANRRAAAEILRQLGTLAAAVVVGAGLSAIQLVPFVYQFLETVDLSYREAGFFRSEPLRYLLSTVFPQSFAGNGLETYTGPFNPVEVNTYVGSVVLLLVLIGVVDLRRRDAARSARIYLTVLALVAVALIFAQGPWSSWLNNLPVFSNNPIGRIRAQLGVPVALLAAFGFDRLVGGTSVREAPAERSGWSWPVAGIAAGLSAVVGVAAVRVATGAQPGLSGAVVADARVSAVPLLVVAALLVAAIRVRRARTMGLAVALVSVAGQAVMATGYYWPTGDRQDFYRVTAAHEFLQDHVGRDRIVTAGVPMLPNATSVAGLRTLTGHAFYPKRTKELLLAVSAESFPAPTYSAFGPHIADVIDSPGLDRMAVRYLVAGADADILGAPDESPATARRLSMSQDVDYGGAVTAGAIRAIRIRLLSVPSRGYLQVTVRDGTTVLARNRHVVAPGDTEVTVPVALDSEPSGQPVPGDLRVDVSSGVSGVVATANVDGSIAVVAIRPPVESDGVRLVYAGDDLVIWERLTHQGRIRWAGTAQVVTSQQQRLQDVVTEPADAGSVILSAPPPAGFDDQDEPAALSVLEDSGDTIRVQVTAEHAGYVVVADNVQADFAATVDGVDADIVDADYAAGAVYVQPGRHQVVLRYQPRGRAAGTTISALSAVVLLAAALPVRWIRITRRRAPAGSS